MEFYVATKKVFLRFSAYSVSVLENCAIQFLCTLLVYLIQSRIFLCFTVARNCTCNIFSVAVFSDSLLSQ